MFKIAGIICIFFSSVTFFVKKSAVDLFTYNFLNQTINIAFLLKNGCSAGKTYRQIFENIDISKLNCYKSFDFSDDFAAVMIDERRHKTVKSFFANLGQRNKYEETEYIQQNIALLDFMAKEYKEKYDKNKQINLLSGFSIGLIVSLVII